jgi:hypothetical protein
MHAAILALAMLLSQAPAPIVLPDNPCDLLTVRQMAIATGLDVIDARRVPDIQELVRAQKEGREPKPGVICSYETRSAFGAITVVVPARADQTTAKYRDILERQRQQAGSSMEILRGLALHAWTSNRQSVHVLVRDDAHFSVTTQMYDPRSQALVISVAQAILKELEARHA